MFEEQHSCPVGSQSEKDKLFPYDLLRAELYFPTRKDIIQSNKLSALISVESSSVFRVEFRDKKRGTSKFVSDIKWVKITNKVLNTERVASWGIDASNSISKIFYASSTLGIKVGGTIGLDHCVARGKTCSNNDFGQIHALLLNGRKWRN